MQRCKPSTFGAHGVNVSYAPCAMLSTLGVSAGIEARMSRVVKKILLVAAALMGLVIIVFIYAVHADQKRLGAAANPCEHDCLQDSGGVEDCRKLCASHPTTYGPASQQGSH